jgi:hypothetical protein
MRPDDEPVMDVFADLLQHGIILPSLLRGLFLRLFLCDLSLFFVGNYHYSAASNVRPFRP